MPNMNGDIYNLLELGRWDDLLISEEGWEAQCRPDIAMRAYEIRINAPLVPEKMEMVVNFAKPVSATAVKNLFNLCNGLRVGATKFSVFGILNTDSETEKYPLLFSPFDLNIPNIYGRPNGLANDSLIVGSSIESKSVGGDKLLHVMQLDGQIQIIKKDEAKTCIRRYDDVRKWLVSEFNIAVADRSRY